MSHPRTDYHGAKWNEPVIYELGRKGRTGFTVPGVEEGIRSAAGDVLADIPAPMRRRRPPNLPELSEPEVVRHFIRLSQETFGVDSGINVGVGTCTMKYNPKINESLARSQKIQGLHPAQPEDTVQGVLEVMHTLGRWLCEISGLDECSLQPRAGAHAIFTNMLVARAYHASRGESAQRDEVVTTVLSHPSNGAAPAMAGYQVVTLDPDKETGLPNVEAMKAAVSKHTAALTITDPYNTGDFDPNLPEYIKIVHEAGGLVAVDQANANGVLGRLRVGELGADMCQFNLHKSFSVPHASAGPGSAPVCVKGELSEFLPVPQVEFDGRRYHLTYERPGTIGKVSGFYGVIPNVLRAYAWISSMGGDGLKEVSDIAVLNNNYLTQKLLRVRGVTLPWNGGAHHVLQEGRFSLEKMKDETGVGIEEVNRRIVDYGLQRCFASHEPLLIPEPFTPEPTESASREDLDTFAEVFQLISAEAYSNPGVLTTAPHNCAISAVDRSVSTNPNRWALTWRALLRKGKHRARPAMRHRPSASPEGI